MAPRKASLGSRISDSVTGGGSAPPWVNRSPQSNVCVLSSIRKPHSQAWGKCGASNHRTERRRRLAGRPAGQRVLPRDVGSCDQALSCGDASRRPSVTKRACCSCRDRRSEPSCPSTESVSSQIGAAASPAVARQLLRIHAEASATIRARTGLIPRSGSAPTGGNTPPM
jgi:hypothetical protein